MSYDGFGPNQGIHVEKDDALSYAMDACGIEPQKGKKIDPEFAQLLEEWFFSGNWI